MLYYIIFKLEILRYWSNDRQRELTAENEYDSRATKTTLDWLSSAFAFFFVTTIKATTWWLNTRTEIPNAGTELLTLKCSPEKLSRPCLSVDMTPCDARKRASHVNYESIVNIVGIWAKLTCNRKFIKTYRFCYPHWRTTQFPTPPFALWNAPRIIRTWYRINLA